MKKDLQTSRESLHPVDCLLLIVDVQQRLIDKMSSKHELVQNIVRLASLAKIIGMPVVVAEQVNLGETVEEIKAVTQDITPKRKESFSCFLAPEIELQVRGLKRRSIILCGIEAHICISQTALHGLREYHVHVVADAISSRTEENHRIAVERMRDEGATITSTEMVFYELLERAGTEEFRKALKLVK